MQLPEFYIHPTSQGRLTLSALLESEGTIEFIVEKEYFEHKIVLFHVAMEGFWFNLGFKDGFLYLELGKIKPASKSRYIKADL